MRVSKVAYSIGFGLLLLAGQVGAVELSYKWNKGDVHRFHYEDESKFEMKVGGGMPGMGGAEMSGMGMPAGMGGGMGMAVTVKTVTDFSMKVLKRLPGGKAKVELTVLKLDLFQAGTRLPALKKIPPAARKVRAVVDRKGRATFERMVTVYIQDEQVYLGIHKAQVGPGGAAVSASAGGPEGGVDVDLVASIDPKTGRIVASAKVRERPPKLRKVKIKQQDPGIDIFPKRLFEMMVLPDGQMQPGSKAQVVTPMSKMTVALTALQGGVAQLIFSTDTKAAVPLTAPDDDADDDMDMDMDADDDMDPPDMPDMGNMMGGGMPGAPKGSAGPSADMGAKTNANLRFDVKRGRLIKLDGKITVDMSVGGMGKMSTTSDFELTRI